MPLTLLRHATQKPPIGSLKLDIGHPFASGLVSACLENEIGSATLFDPVQQRSITRYNNGGANCGTFWDTSSPWGIAIRHDNTGTGTVQSTQLNLGVLSLSSTFTVVLACYMPSGFANSSSLIAPSAAGGFEVRAQTTGNVLTLLSDSSHAFPSSSSGIPTNQWFTCSVSRDVSNNIAYSINGISAGGGGVDSTSIDWTKAIWIGGSNGIESFTNGLGTSWCYFWNRALSYEDIAEINAEPFAMFQTRPMQRWFTIVSAGGATIPPGLGPVVSLTEPTLTADLSSMMR